MKDPRLLAAIGVIIALPLLAASVGVGRGAGLIVGLILVAGGVVAMVLGSRRG